MAGPDCAIPIRIARQEHAGGWNRSSNRAQGSRERSIRRRTPHLHRHTLPPRALFRLHRERDWREPLRWCNRRNNHRRGHGFRHHTVQKDQSGYLHREETYPPDHHCRHCRCCCHCCHRHHRCHCCHRHHRCHCCHRHHRCRCCHRCHPHRHTYSKQVYRCRYRCRYYRCCHHRRPRRKSHHRCCCHCCHRYCHRCHPHLRKMRNRPHHCCYHCCHRCHHPQQDSNTRVSCLHLPSSMKSERIVRIGMTERKKTKNPQKRRRRRKIHPRRKKMKM